MFFCFFGRSTFIFWGKRVHLMSNLLHLSFCFVSFRFVSFFSFFFFDDLYFLRYLGAVQVRCVFWWEKEKKEKSILNCSPQITIRFICRPNVNCLTRHWNLKVIDICSISLDCLISCCLWKYQKINWNCCISNIFL